MYLNVSVFSFGAFKGFFHYIALILSSSSRVHSVDAFACCFDFAPSGHGSPPHSVVPNAGRVIGLISELIVCVWAFTVTKLDDFFLWCVTMATYAGKPVLEKIRSHV